MGRFLESLTEHIFSPKYQTAWGDYTKNLNPKTPLAVTLYSVVIRLGRLLHQELLLEGSGGAFLRNAMWRILVTLDQEQNLAQTLGAVTQAFSRFVTKPTVSIGWKEGLGEIAGYEAICMGFEGTQIGVIPGKSNPAILFYTLPNGARPNEWIAINTAMQRDIAALTENPQETILEQAKILMGDLAELLVAPVITRKPTSHLNAVAESIHLIWKHGLQRELGQTHTALRLELETKGGRILAEEFLTEEGLTNLLSQARGGVWRGARLDLPYRAGCLLEKRVSGGCVQVQAPMILGEGGEILAAPHLCVDPKLLQRLLRLTPRTYGD